MNLETYLEKVGEWVVTSGPRIIFIIILTLVALKAAGVISDKLVSFFGKSKDDPEMKKRADTLSSVIRYVLVIAIFLMAGMMVLKQIGIDIGPLLAGAGIVGLAVGFGGQSLVKDVITGFFILLEDQIRVGDVVQIAGKSGLVEKVNLRMTILRDASGNVHFVRNGEIDVVTNMTKDFSRYVFEIGVAYREDVDEVIKVIKEVDEDLRKDPEYKDDIISPIDVLGLDQFGNSAIVIKARTTTKPIKQWRVGREFNRRLKKRFDELKIEIPFPHLTLYLGEDKKGKAPPLRVTMQELMPQLEGRQPDQGDSGKEG